jgi:hypothetical protein
MINIPGQIETKDIVAPRKGYDRTGREAGKNGESTFSSFFTQYLEPGEKRRDNLKSSEQTREYAAADKRVKTGEKTLTVKKPTGGKQAQRGRLLKNRGIEHLSARALVDKTLHNRKKSRLIQLMAGNRLSKGLIRKRIHSLDGKKQLSLSVLKNKSTGSKSTIERSVVLAKKHIEGKNRIYNKHIFKEGEAAKSGNDTKKDQAITGDENSDRIINSVKKRAGAVSLKVRNNDSLFNGTDAKKNAVLKTGDSDNVLGKKTAAGELSAACVKYDSNVPKTAVKPDHQIHRNADEIFNDIVKRFSLVVKKGGGEARIVLQPEVLGQLKMKMSLNKNVVNTFMVVDSEAVKDLILGKLNILEQNLLQQGFNLGSFQVDVKDKNTEFGTPGDEINNGHRIDDLDEEDSIPEIEKSPGVPWISTIVNLTA